MSETEESERRAEEVKRVSRSFIEALDIDDVIAHLLIGEGFRKVEELLAVPVEDLAVIEGFELEVAQELQNRARTYLKAQEKKSLDALKEAGVKKDLIDFDGLTMAEKLVLKEADIKTLDDLADLAADELRDLLPQHNIEDANAIIMKAREHWFDEDDSKKPDEQDAK